MEYFLENFFVRMFCGEYHTHKWVPHQLGGEGVKIKEEKNESALEGGTI